MYINLVYEYKKVKKISGEGAQQAKEEAQLLLG